MAIDPWAIDSAGGAPAYSAQELRLGTLAPLLAGAGASLGVRSGVRPSGSGSDLLVAPQGVPNMSVLVQPGIAVVQGAITTTQGPYSYVLDTATTLAIAASHATLDRTDLICIRIRDASVDSSGARDGAVVVVQGTNGGGVPAVPTGATYYVLAQVFVQHAVTSIVAGAITDMRTFLCAVGGIASVTTKTASYTATVNDDVILANGAAVTITLPAAAAAGAGRRYLVKNINTSQATVATGGGTIDGLATIALNQWQSRTFISDGTNWYLI